MTSEQIAYRVLCDPEMLRQTVVDPFGAGPEISLKDRVLPAFSGERGRVLLRSDAWRTRRGLDRKLRSVQGLSESSPGWLAFPLSELGSKSLRHALWWSSLGRPLSFVLEVEAPSEAWVWFLRTWPEVDEENKHLLRPYYCEPKEYVADEIDRILADRPGWGPRRAIAGFFNDGFQAWVSEGEIEPGGP